MSISTETREHTLGPVRAELLQLIAARRPADGPVLAEFATAYLRRLSVDTAQSTPVEELYGETVGVFDFAAGRGDRPILVRAFNPSAEEHGYERPGSVLETNTEDLPFLVDSVTGALHTSDLKIMRVLHPIVGLERDDAGRIVRVLHPREATARESVMHFELDRRLDDAQLDELASSVRSVLGDVRRAVLDFPAMADRGRRMVQLASAGAARYADDEVDETVAFLEWLLQDHFIFLGYREYRIEDDTLGVVPGSGLGILADEASSAYARPRPLADLPDEVRERALEGDLLIVSKTNRLSTVHRRTRMDYVGVRKIGPDGRVTGEARMLGLFTSKAYAEPASPDAAAQPQAAPDPPPRGPDRGLARLQDGGRALRLVPEGRAVLGAHRRPAPRRRRAARRSRATASGCSAAAARTARRLADRRAPGRPLRPRAAREASRRCCASASARARWRRTRCSARPSRSASTSPCTGPRACPTSRSPSSSASSSRSRARGRTSCATSSSRAEGPTRGARARRPLGPALPGVLPRVAGTGARRRRRRCFDRLEREGAPFLVGLQNEAGPHARRALQAGREGRARRRDADARGPRPARHRGGPTRLLGGDGETWVQDFGVLGPDGAPLDLDAVGERVADCITAVRRGDTESDTLNRLVRRRAWTGARSTSCAPTACTASGSARASRRATRTTCWRRTPASPPSSMRYFEPRFDPARPRDEAAEEALRDEILADLDAVASLDHDRILRNQLGLIDATLRTNAYSRAAR